MNLGPLNPLHPSYLIVGQGLAGTLLAHFLIKKGQQVRVMDDNYERAASKVAAGIINPITGRRFAKSWKIDELLPFAAKTYSELEQQLGISIFHKKNILRVLFSQKEENTWLSRSIWPTFSPYVIDYPDGSDYDNKIKKGVGFAELKESAKVDIKKLVEQYRIWLKKQKCLVEGTLDYDKINLSIEGKVGYKGHSYKKIIFCEGYQATQNPFFNYLPFQAAKGEALIIRIDNFPKDKMLKHKVFFVPLGENLYWIGSNYEWKFKTDMPTQEGRIDLEQKLQKVLHLPFEVVEHLAAVRPTVEDRRPLAGLHPKFPQLAVFNGLGTKGASLSPYFAEEMAAFLVEGRKLDEEVDIARL